MNESQHFFVWGNMAWNALLIAVVGYLVKNWMSSVIDKLEEMAKCLNGVKVGLESKLDKDAHNEKCDKRQKEIWDRMYNHSHTPDGRVIAD